VNKRNAFTLVELLVVISIIALLMSILMPSLSAARENAFRVVCISNTKNIALANEIYANEYDDRYVPVRDDRMNSLLPGDPKGDQRSWAANMRFRTIVGYLGKNIDDALLKIDPAYEDVLTIVPEDFQCPSDRVVKKNQISGYDTLWSYGYNVTDWAEEFGTRWFSPGSPNIIYGHIRSRVRQPASKLAFIDSCDWWVQWYSANYIDAWDVFGQVPPDVYNPPYGGPVLYRHSESAVIGFYDGHVECQGKERVFDHDDFNANPQRPGMWVGNEDDWP